MANIPAAQSGEVPFSAIKNPPRPGPMEIAVIQFGRASSGLGDTDQSVLASVAAIHKRNGGTVRIVAHASQDASGSSVDALERGNYEVSRRRALAIAAQLQRDGVPRSAIIAEAASDGEPKYSTVTASGIAANRRAEVFIDF
jgi:outer membrane protein OmpA-like peptidoglycan-associated protein